MVPVTSNRISRVPLYSGFSFEFLIFRLQDYHLLRYRFPTTSTILRLSSLLMESFNPNPKIGLGCSPFARHYLGNRLLSFFSSGYLDVSVHRVALYKVMYSLYDTSSFITSGFPHSEISGSKYTYYSPKHIVVCHVLLQLLVPRHPPCALTNLTTIFDITILI